jgi:signal transduction histidine kinase/ligand-binding sensor domain-containing protein/DNA-binding response OmpR family regulator
LTLQSCNIYNLTLHYFTCHTMFHLKYILHFIVFFFILVIPLFSSQISHFKRFSVKDGLSNNTVLDIDQDHYGRIWLATYDGISCYDGFGFFTVKPRLISTGEVLPVGETDRICVDSIGNVWVLFEKSELIRIVGNQGECFRYENVKELFLDGADMQLNKDGNLVLITAHKVLAYDAKVDSFKVAGLRPPQSSETEIQDLRKHLETIAPGVIIHAIYPDHSEVDYWVATRNRGVYRVSKKDFSDVDHYGYHPSKNKSLSSDEINVIFIDRAGSLWAGTKDGGVCQGFKEKFPVCNIISSQDPLFVNSPIRALLRDRDSVLWMGTYNQGVVRQKGDDIKHFSHSAGMKDSYWDWIRSIYQTSDGYIWVGSYRGLIRIHPKSLEKTFFSADTMSGPLKYGRTYSMVEDAIGNLFIAEWGALTYYDRQKERFYRVDTLSELGGKDIRKLHLDNSGNLWVGTESSGIFILDGDSKQCIKRYYSGSKVDEINSNSIFEITEDPSGNIWIGSFKGLNRIDSFGNVVDVEWVNKRLPSSIIYKVFFDYKERLWCSTPKGLVRIDMKEKAVRIFDQNDGLEISEYLEGAGFMDEHGNLHLGGVKGLCYFKPEIVPEINQLPVNLLESVWLNGKRQHLPFTSDFSKVHSYSFNNNSFAFNLKSVSIDYPLQSQIAWKLEPFDNDFTTKKQATAEISYKNLPPGNYRLLTKAANADGLWSGEQKMFTFTINKPFWQQTYFLVIFILLLVGIAYLIFRFRLEQIKSKNKELESLVEIRTLKIKMQKTELENANIELAEKNRKMMAQKDHILAQRDHLIEMHKKLEESSTLQQKFFMNISHDIRTPLSLIHGPISEIMQLRDIPADVMAKMQMIQTQSMFLIRLLNQILDKKKLETGGSQLVFTHGDIIEVCKGIMDSFLLKAQENNVRITFQASHKSYHLRFDFDKLRQILLNLMANAVKFTPPGGTISCHLNLTPTTIELKVSDSGIGIPGDRIKYIFNRYYQIGKSTDSQNDGTGIGLSLVKDYIDLFQGHIKVESQEGKGSCFNITLPLSQQPEPEANASLLSIDTSSELAIPHPDSPFEQKDCILLVEDNGELRDYLVDILAKHYNVVAVENGQAAIDYLRKNRSVSVILSDWIMPVMDGIELCKNLKRKARYKTIPYILLTALSEVDNQIEAYQCGVDDFISKPFDPELLYLKISLLLKRNLDIKMAAIVDDKIEPNNKIIKSFNEKLFEQLKAAVEHELSNANFGQAELALAVGMSQMQLYRRLKDLAKMSPHEFIRSIRLKRAKQLLENEALIINEVGYLSGFNDPKYFSRCFSKETGMSPTKYRQTLTNMNSFATNIEEFSPSKQ